MSKEDIEYIRDNAGVKSPAEIATKIGRTVEAVSLWLQANLPHGVTTPHKALPNDRGSISEQLKRTALWTRLKKEFDEEELEHFSERYSAYMQQFRSDLFATEVDMMVNYIRTDILMGRNMEARKANIEMLTRFEEEFRSLPANSKATEKRRAQLEDLIATYKSADAARSKEYIELQSAYNRAAEKLKATRDQRISKIDSMKETFTDIIKALASAPNRDRVGEEMEIGRSVVFREMERLTTPHKFENGQWDLPILNADSLSAAGELPRDEVDATPDEPAPEDGGDSDDLLDHGGATEDLPGGA